MSRVHVEPATRLAGEVQLPGDKSISHRVLLLSLLGSEPTTLDNLAPGSDIDATLSAIALLGAKVQHDRRARQAIITGAGPRPAAPAATIDARNSGTLARMLAGLATRCTGTVRIDGDESLRLRPMRRVATPLQLLGAEIELSGDHHLPMSVAAPRGISGGRLEVRVPSSQVASAIMLAATGAREPLQLSMPAGLRSHTQVHLARAGVRIDGHGTELTIHPCEELALPDTRIPADMSAAAPIITAAALLPGSLVRLPGLGMDPGRIGLVELLDRSGGNVALHGRSRLDGEPVADIEVKGARPSGMRISGRDAATMIDELPLVALLLHFVRGETRIRGAGELRHKESDRIRTTVRALRSVGVAIEETPDGFVVRGSGARPKGGTIDAEGDHRIAILGAVAGLVSRSGVTIEGADAAGVSWPDAVRVLDALAVR